MDLKETGRKVVDYNHLDENWFQLWDLINTAVNLQGL